MAAGARILVRVAQCWLGGARLAARWARLEGSLTRSTSDGVGGFVNAIVVFYNPSEKKLGILWMETILPMITLGGPCPPRTPQTNSWLVFTRFSVNNIPVRDK